MAAMDLAMAKRTLGGALPVADQRGKGTTREKARGRPRRALAVAGGMGRKEDRSGGEKAMGEATMVRREGMADMVAAAKSVAMVITMGLPGSI